MTNSEKNRAQLSASADKVGERVAGGSVNEITAEHVEVLQEAGIPNATIAQLLREAGMEESDVAGFVLGAPIQEPGIIITTRCIGTCKKHTIEIDFTTAKCPGN
ncbi:MAG: hypothetical protein ACRDJ9_01675 [Dehalococcoidia bacterium]